MAQGKRICSFVWQFIPHKTQLLYFFPRCLPLDASGFPCLVFQCSSASRALWLYGLCIESPLPAFSRESWRARGRCRQILRWQGGKRYEAGKMMNPRNVKWFGQTQSPQEYEYNKQGRLHFSGLSSSTVGGVTAACAGIPELLLT